jgi:hypothetical protein
MQPPLGHTAHLLPEVPTAPIPQDHYARLAQLLKAHPEVGEQDVLGHMLPIVMENSSFKSKRRKILQLTDSIGRAIDQFSLCKKGCAHCCHMPTLIYAHEAEELGKASGIAPKQLAYRERESVLEEAAAYVGMACPFLNQDQSCSVYAHRPLICKLHHSLGDDPAACTIINGFPKGHVPKIDPDLIEMPYHGLVRRHLPGEPWGAIQDFFPSR